MSGIEPRDGAGIEPVRRDADLEALELLLGYATKEAGRFGLNLSSYYGEQALQSMTRPKAGMLS